MRKQNENKNIVTKRETTPVGAILIARRSQRKCLKHTQNGITLVALVITIIVLLILSGITITLVFSDDGVVKKAEQAKEQTKRAQVIESVQLELLTAQMEEDIIKAKLVEILSKYGTIKYVNDNSDNDILGLEVDGVTDIISIAEIYKEELSVLEGSATDIVATGYEASIYGKTVNYTVSDSTTQSALTSNNITWKILYIGSDYSTTGNHIYLIASDYVPRANLPQSSGKHSLNDGSYARSAYFSNILNDYSGSASITSIELQKLNNSYFSQGFTSTNNNMKAVAYMMDTSAWGTYANSTYADFAIGGPSIEMIMKSYSQKYSNSYTAKAYNATGYQLSKDGTNYADYYFGMITSGDSLYMIREWNNACGYYVSSPPHNTSEGIMLVDYSSAVGVCLLNYETGGFRPLVSLSSDVKLIKKSDGTFDLTK